MATRPAKCSTADSSSTTAAAKEKSEQKTKIDPSFKSKRYRDKLRTEVKSLESLLPVDRTALSRKLDSQTVFRLVIALLRTKGYFHSVGLTQETTGYHDSVQKHLYDVHTDSDTDDLITEFIQGQACLQVLDGFLLVLTADGTILYVSDNVLQYIGYNQVDLMHRCLYSIVHQDDMMDLKVVLETSLGHLVTHYDQQSNQDSKSRIEECSLGTREACKPVSFLCRMRCFSGSSVGYLKMHCSGKIVQHASLPKSKRSSRNVVLLFCNPFMLRAAEFSTELQKNVFWSKHDLDLNIKEVDKKGLDITGFQSEQLEKQSFYSIVHPEDLTAVATCHRLLLESSEVQTVYFRLQTKGGDWVWLTSRGKVISKNSKKFSIAFSHCPLREEDSTYIQQEAILRRRYAISDLMCLSQFKQPESVSLGYGTAVKDDTHHIGPASKTKKADQNRFLPYDIGGSSGMKGSKSDSKKEDPSLLDTSCILEVSCPSAWHAMSDRHSPVLPSSHVAHKISQREKQLQFQEFCRRQQMGEVSQNNLAKSNPHWDESQTYSASPGDIMATSCDGGQANLTNSGPPYGQGSSVTHTNELNGFSALATCSVDYGLSQPSNGVPFFFHHWFHSEGMHHSAPSCLTPSRSPHQCGAVPPPFSQGYGSVRGQYYFQPSADPVSQHLASFPCPAMPPSPPPSPLLANQRPSFQATDAEFGVVNYQQPSLFLSSCRHPSEPPPPYPRLNHASNANTLPSSTITDLKNTTEKFLLPKNEIGCEKAVKKFPSAPQECTSTTAPLNKHERSDTLNGQPSTSSKESIGSQPYFPFGGNQYINFEHPFSKHSSVSTSHIPQGFQDSIHPSHFLQTSSASAMSPYMSYPGPFPPQTNFALAPPYPYGMYHQLGYQAGQYPANRFYAPQSAPVKTSADHPRAMVERPLDLPSIGSFLEYLNEV